jgi:uncharacterized protein YhbP (UPF0306 family)
LNRSELRSGIKFRLENQNFAILSSVTSVGTIHSTIVCFVAADDLSTLVFVTPRASRKFTNLQNNPEAALFIDDRSLYLGELRDVWGVEARGRVRVAGKNEAGLYQEIYLAKYPDLADFAGAESSAWCLMDVDIYDVVHRFQDVMRYVPGTGA